MKIPEYLPLLSSIKQLFSNEDKHHPDKHILLNWAKKLAILQLQQSAQSPSQSLLDSLIKDKADIMAIIVKLNALFDASHINNKQDLQQFHQIVEHFYQQLNRLHHTYTELERHTLWRNPLSTHESTITLKAKTHDKQDGMPSTPSSTSSLTATENTSVLSKVSGDSSHDENAHKNESLFLKQLFDDKDI
ncbi:hypothetical protein [uncultured Shewanella sp.]|uniref:hypothetical protein n=1 Tax=uncultured Shewanella sp. TaxID=173975 RepID=UPI002630E6F0|nr:hypothetical protein [uncultured Shewanella sp.]